MSPREKEEKLWKHHHGCRHRLRSQAGLVQILVPRMDPHSYCMTLTKLKLGSLSLCVPISKVGTRLPTSQGSPRAQLRSYM